MTKHRPIVWWVSVYDVTQHLGIHQDDQTVVAVRQAVDLHLLRANSRDDPRMVCVTYDGIRLVEKAGSVRAPGYSTTRSERTW